MSKLSENAEKVLQARYYQEGENWDRLCRRVAKFVGRERDEETQRAYYNVMNSLRFLPNSPTLMNAGTQLKNLSACFVLPVPDNMQGIYDILRVAALIQAEGGGTGFDFSELRANGAKVSRTNGKTSGPISFLRVFDASTEIVKQGGRRRGANMANLRVDHRDILEFIRCKRVEGDIRNFNLSVSILDSFMEAVENNEDWTLSYGIHDLDPIVIPAKEIMDAVVDGAWQNGEPGMFFLDTTNRLSSISEHISGTNPCGEIPLPPFGSCNLGSINLFQFINSRGKIDYSELEYTVRIAIDFLDDVVSVNEYVDERITESSLKYRPLGLGVMGWADFLLMKKVTYGSEESLELAKQIMRFISDIAKDESEKLLGSRGPNGEEDHKRRNAMLTSIAPTGTLSLIAGCSSGIEPNFAWEYSSNRIDRVLHHYHPLAYPYMKDGKKLPEWFVTSLEVAPEQHVDMQAGFQEYVDHAISKTVNLPYHATKDDVREIFFRAWRKGCKGITVYRDGSRQEQVLVAKTTADLASPEKTHPIKRPLLLQGVTVKKDSFYVTVNTIADTPAEVFLHGMKTFSPDGLGRLISLALRSNVSISEVIDQLKRCQTEEETLVGEALEEAIQNLQDGQASHQIDTCPVCGGKVVKESGCSVCKECGWSACSIS